MNKSNKVLTLLTVALTAFSPLTLTACDKNEGNGEAIVQSVYPTFKVMQNATDFPAGTAEIDVALAQGETESAQLVLTAQGNVSSYELIASDIQNENGDKFGIDNIEVNVQYYVNVEIKTSGNTNTTYPTGWTPDMLLPMEICKAYGENKIAAGNNQGLTIEFTADANTPAGTYTGSFSLKVDQKTYNIPVSVEVWDIDVSKAYGKTWIGIELSQMWFGELSNSDELYKAYYDTLLNKYKTCGGMLPGTYDLHNFVATLDEYWGNPNFTTYEIPAPKNWYIQDSTLFDYIYLLANATIDKKLSNTPIERFYLDRAVILPFDEPQSNMENFNDRVSVCTQQVENAELQVWNRIVAEGRLDAITDEGGTGLNSNFAKRLQESLDISSVVTTHEVDYWGDMIMSYCPAVQHYNTALDRMELAEHAEKWDAEQWFYTCMQPVYPYPSHHIDDYLIGSRTMRWMQKAYNIEGYLYWCATQYSQSTDAGYQPLDPYTNPARYFFNGKTFNGDGYLFYPGKKYDSSTPFGSVRLDALRDGQEDYNLMCAYQEKLNELQNYYGWATAPDVNEVIGLSFDNLFKGSVYSTDDSALFTARELLARKAVLASGDAKFFYEIKANADGSSTAIFYASEGTQVTFNGERLTNATSCGQGVQYSKTFNAIQLKELQISVVKGEKTIDFTDSLGQSKASASVNKDNENLIYVSENSQRSVNGNELTVLLKSWSDPDSMAATERFTPRIDLGKGLFPVNFKEIQTISFEITYIPSTAEKIHQTRDFTIALSVDTSKKGKQLDRYRIKAGETIRIECKNVYQTAATLNAGYLSLQFDNKYFDYLTNTSGLFADGTFIISNVQYSVRGAK